MCTTPLTEIFYQQVTKCRATQLSKLNASRQTSSHSKYIEKSSTDKLQFEKNITKMKKFKKSTRTSYRQIIEIFGGCIFYSFQSELGRCSTNYNGQMIRWTCSGSQCLQRKLLYLFAIMFQCIKREACPTSLRHEQNQILFVTHCVVQECRVTVDFNALICKLWTTHSKQ